MYLSLKQMKFIGSNERKAVTCEHQQLDIRCGREEVINVISAMYGRTDYHTCSNGRKHATTSCRAKHSTEIVRGRCQGKNGCLVTASNSVFGDPCGGTFKYLTVSYKCQSEYHHAEYCFTPYSLYLKLKIISL